MESGRDSTACRRFFGIRLFVERDDLVDATVSYDYPLLLFAVRELQRDAVQARDRRFPHVLHQLARVKHVLVRLVRRQQIADERTTTTTSPLSFGTAVSAPGFRLRKLAITPVVFLPAIGSAASSAASSAAVPVVAVAVVG